MSEAFEKMDRMYRLQRHIYDPTRKFYLLGRDELLDEIEVETDADVLEVGCGTGRNLAMLARRYPQTRFHGIDASAAMLQTAESRYAGLANISFHHGLADEVSAEKLNAAQGFAAIFFSYSLSMIPAWRASIENAIANVRPGGKVYIVDFYDQRSLPKAFRKVLRWWLELFGVRFDPALLQFLEELRSSGRIGLEVRPLYRRYAFIAKITPRD